MNQTKLTLCYTYFNGFEQLVESLCAMHLHVDEIIICYQTISNTGNRSEDVRNDMLTIKQAYPNVRLIYFEPFLNVNTKENERLKHDLMIQEAKKIGSTHFIMAGCDHIYSPKSISHAIQVMLSNQSIDVTFTKMITYYKRNDWMLFPLEDYYMPFIHKMHPNTGISKTAQYMCHVDPSVKVNTCNDQLLFNENEAILHHFSMVRSDIRGKFSNAAASIRWKPQQIETFIQEFENAKPGDKITYFQGREIKQVESGLLMLK